MKRFLAVCLVLVLAFSLAPTAFAAGRGGGGNGVGQRDRLHDGSCGVCVNESCPYYPNCPGDGSCQLLFGVPANGGGKGGQQRLRDGSCLIV
jgi:hypothetical protein